MRWMQKRSDGGNLNLWKWNLSEKRKNWWNSMYLEWIVHRQPSEKKWLRSKSVLERRTELLRFMATSLLHRENVIRQWHMRLERSWQKNCGAVSIRYWLRLIWIRRIICTTILWWTQFHSLMGKDTTGQIRITGICGLCQTVYVKNTSYRLWGSQNREKENIMPSGRQNRMGSRVITAW